MAIATRGDTEPLQFKGIRNLNVNSVMAEYVKPVLYLVVA